jgi:amidase
MLSLDVLGGPASSEANAWSWRLLPPRQKRIRDFRIGYVLDDDFAPLASDIRRVYEEFIVTLKRYGARLQRGWPKGIDPKAQFRTYEYLVLALLSLSASDRDVEAQRKKLKKDPEDTYAAAFAAPHARWLRETLRRLRFRTLWQEYFGNHDVFLLPTAFTTAFPHLCKKDVWADGTIDTPEGERPYGQLVYWISTASLTGLPATVAPVGRTSSGLPVGIQILAPIWEDATAIEFASLISKVADGFVPPPNFAL